MMCVLVDARAVKHGAVGNSFFPSQLPSPASVSEVSDIPKGCRRTGPPEKPGRTVYNDAESHMVKIIGEPEGPPPHLMLITDKCGIPSTDACESIYKVYMLNHNFRLLALCNNFRGVNT